MNSRFTIHDSRFTAVATLHYVGFGTGGIISGSYLMSMRLVPPRSDTHSIVIGTAAALAQATIGNVVAPGLFATLTSAGAGGYGLAAISGAA